MGAVERVRCPACAGCGKVVGEVRTCPWSRYERFGVLALGREPPLFATPEECPRCHGVGTVEKERAGGTGRWVR